MRVANAIAKLKRIQAADLNVQVAAENAANEALDVVKKQRDEAVAAAANGALDAADLAALGEIEALPEPG